MLMLLIAKAFAVLNHILRFGAWEFQVIKRGNLLPPGWDLAHHEIEGRNGGMLLVPRERGIVWPPFLGRRFRLAVRPPRRHR
jgi:hypothetical protein